MPAPTTSPEPTTTSRRRCARRWTARTPRRRASTRTARCGEGARLRGRRRRARRCTGARPAAAAPDPSGAAVRLAHASVRVQRTRPRQAAWAHAVRTQLRGVRGRRDLQALARQDGHRVRRPPVLPAHDEPPPAAPRRATTPRRPPSSARTSWSATTSTRSCSACRVPTSRARRSPTSRSSRCATWRRPSTATRSTARPPCSTSGSRSRKDDRGVVHVETIGYNQDGKVVCIFRRKVMVPKDSYLEARGGEQPAARCRSPTRTGRAPSLSRESALDVRPTPTGRRARHRREAPGPAGSDEQDQHHRDREADPQRVRRRPAR